MINMTNEEAKGLRYTLCDIFPDMDIKIRHKGLVLKNESTYALRFRKDGVWMIVSRNFVMTTELIEAIGNGRLEITQHNSKSGAIVVRGANLKTLIGIIAKSEEKIIH